MLDIPLSVPIFMPFVAGLLAIVVPGRLARWLVLLAAVGVLGYAGFMVFDFDARQPGYHYVTDVAWIDELGIRYTIGIDGLNLFLFALTAIVWVGAVWAAALREWDRPRLFYFHMGLAETAVLGAFCAQDLALFVLFFDLMLVPFYFLVGGWGEVNRVQATTKLIIYTLVGSLLMLAGAVALGVLATPEGEAISFSLTELGRQRTVPEESQGWIFLLFAIAFLVKAPAFPVHGWMPDAYRAAPLPVLVPLSAVVSKVGVYGFLRIVLPLLPDAAARYQDLILGVAVVSILYGSVLAFSQDNLRLVVGYSSVAQLGFITLGIFAFDPKGAQGAVMQMVNHGLVVAPLFVVIGIVALRSEGSESLRELGGAALRAPVLAALFLLIALATLAMPGSPNFVGELLILFGVLETKLVFGVLASVGIALASVYMIRMFQRTMHNRVGPRVESSEMGLGDFVAVAPLVAVVLALGVYPQFILGRTGPDTVAKVRAPAEAVALEELRTAQRERRGGWVPYAGSVGDERP
jgi:NADH-quinone oxidoreductase subunit M